MTTKKKVIYGILGSRKDSAPGKVDRWTRWRPTIEICRQENLILDEYHLLYSRSEQSLMKVIVRDIELISPKTQVIPHLMEIQDRWDFVEVFEKIRQFTDAENFDPERFDYLVNITTGTYIEKICLFLLTKSRHFPGRLLEIAREGKHSDGTYHIIDLDLTQYDQLSDRFAQDKLESTSLLKSGINTKNVVFNQMIDQIEKVAIKCRMPILLTGRTGVGKTRLAQKIYDLKKKQQKLTGKLVPINCATLSGDQMKSAFFGYVRGAFTGAISDRSGLLQLAHKGVLFLDEIGELGLDEQAALLHVIEEKTFYPVGSDDEKQCDFQLIAGTNRDLKMEVKKGTFREDLLARIELWTWRLPDLAERPEDILPNIEYELQRYFKETGNILRFNKDALTKYLNFAQSPQAVWTGNFRDLAASISRMGILSCDNRICLHDVDCEIERLIDNWRDPSQTKNPTSSSEDLLKRYLGPERLAELDRFDRPQLAEVIAVCHESANISEAGRKLFNNSRNRRRSVNDADRLRKYLAKFELAWDDLR